MAGNCTVRDFFLLKIWQGNWTIKSLQDLQESACRAVTPAKLETAVTLKSTELNFIQDRASHPDCDSSTKDLQHLGELLSKHTCFTHNLIWHNGMETLTRTWNSSYKSHCTTWTKIDPVCKFFMLRLCMMKPHKQTLRGPHPEAQLFATTFKVCCAPPLPPPKKCRLSPVALWWQGRPSD